MISTFKKATIISVITAFFFTTLIGCTKNTPIKQTGNDSNQSSSTSDSTSSSAPSVDSNSVVYSNTDYGFNFSLPVSWKGYSVVTSNWQGTDVKSGNVTETGMIYSIRNPQWTSKQPRQDVPIMVFTLNQWELIKKESLAVSAAPIGPSELGRNSKYVFALPARYNFAYLTGYEEVEQILKNKPLQTTEVFDKSTTVLLNIIQLAKLGKVINSEFPVKTTTIKTVEQTWGQPNKTDIIAAKGTYATFTKYKVVFGYNKEGQIVEVRSLDTKQFENLTLSKVKKVLGTPSYDVKYNFQEIIRYDEGPEFKIEMVFPVATANTPNPAMDHYNILYTAG